MKFNKKSKSSMPKFNTGGDIANVVGGLSPLLNLVMPGLGTGVGAVAGIAQGMFNKQNLKEQEQNLRPSQYNNPSAFGYAHGGQLPNDSMQVMGGKGQMDGIQMNYKGQDIAVDYGETIDTSKDRVVSNRIENPRTGNMFAMDDAKLKKVRGKMEKMYKRTNDIGAKHTMEMAQKMEDSLFQEQEIVKMLQDMKSNKQNSQPQRSFAVGGDINDPGVPGSVWRNILDGMKFNSGYPMGQIGTPTQFTDIERTRFPYESGQYDQLSPIAARNLSSLPALKSMNQVPVNERVNMALNGSSAGSNTKSPGFLSNMSTGEKIAVGANVLSLGAKAVEAFSPYKKQEPYLNNTAINQMQLDPTLALRNMQETYQVGLNDVNNQSNSFNQRQALASNLFSNQLDAQNKLLTDYSRANADYAQQYESRLSDRKNQNNAAQAQAESITEANRAKRQNMRDNLYNSVNNVGMNLADMYNTKDRERNTLAILKKLNPDVYQNLINEINKKDK